MRTFASTLALCALAGSSAWADALPIVPDGRFDDWGAATPLHTDPSGDVGSSDIDFGTLYVANDADRLYLRFEVGADKKLQENNSVMLYVDSDNSAATGLAVGGIGAEFKWDFGARTGTAYSPGAGVAGSSNWLPFGLRQEPTVSGDEFEIAFDRAGMVSGVSLFQGSTIALLLQNEDGGVQDRLPNAAQTVTYTFDNSAVTPHPTIPLGKLNPSHVRVLTHNVLFDTLFSNSDPHARILQALQPDIICYQEIYSHTAVETRDLVAAALGGTWYAVDEGADTITVSRWPILTSQDLSGNLGTLVDLPDTPYLTDLYLINVHPPCCTNDAGRQSEIDEIIAWFRDLQSPGGVETLDAGTPIVFTGDTNFVGFAQQRETLLTGDIQDEGTYGPDFAPDWDASLIADVFPTHTTGAETYTWRSDGGSFPPGRLDYFAYTDSVVTAAKNFILWTPDMSPAELSAAGLLADDSTDASDHVPVVLDLVIPGATIPVGLSLLGTVE